MNRYLLLGLIFSLGGGLLVLFEGIGAMMTAGDIVFKTSSPVELLGGQAFAWIDRIPLALVQDLLDSLVAQPAWMILVALGVVCFVLAGITSR
jgi:hypothetical protein